MDRERAIGDHALLGDGRGAALVGSDGTIDWLCWPRFDSPSLLGSLIDRERGGYWRVAPTAIAASERSYRRDSNVLETRFSTARGTLVLTDLMTVATEAEKEARLWPDHELLRVARCTEGEVEIESCFAPRPGYGTRATKLRDRGAFGMRLHDRAHLVALRATVPLALSPDRLNATARVRLRAGESCAFSLTSDAEIAVFPPLAEWAREAIDRTDAWWRGWVGQLRYRGRYRDAVVRSALALKLLGYAPSGAIVAAPTTSLPERPGGDLNWDYRYCWLRDAALTARALFGLGYDDEAEAFVSWLLHTTRLTSPRLAILYDVMGRAPRRERRLERLAGYRGARPVRVGNAAHDQLQLDVYGEVIDATTHFVRQGNALDRATQRLLRDFADFVCGHWRDADEGIWEPRSGRRSHTHSRVLCWTALDRVITLAEKGHLRARHVDHWRCARDNIRADVEEHAWCERIGSYIAEYGSDRLDASLLLLPWYGYTRPEAPRMRSTWRAIRERLGAGGPLLYRNREPETPGEGAFGIASFWGAEYLALGGGTVDEACAAFEGLLGYANDVGLFGEEIDPATGAALGNFPQAFTHVGLIGAALSIEAREGQRREAGHTPPRAPDLPSVEART